MKKFNRIFDIRNKHKIIALILVVLLISNANLSISAYANEESNYETSIENNVDDDNIDISDLILSEEEIKEANSYLEQEREKGNIQNKPRRSKRNPLLAGVFFIPGVGQAVITAAGVIVVGGVIVSGTSLLGQRITDWIKFKKNTQPNIPKEMKNGENSIDLSKFSKDGKTAKGKNGQGGPYKYNKDGKWILEKDTARHGGRVWKLKFNNNRIKSIGKDGEILND